MAVKRHARRREWATRILQSDVTPLEKVRRLVALGYDEETADSMVTGGQVGLSQALYYEQLPQPDYKD